MARAPEGDPAPADGRLPASALSELDAPFGVYVHVPFCAARCGYCDFNTYTAGELGDSGESLVHSYVTAALAELDLAGRRLAESGERVPQAQTVFFGGGTPSLLAPGDIDALVSRVRTTFGLAPDAEVTMEANPESVDPAKLAGWRAAGVTRMSFGMQSADIAVLATLDRRHSPGRVADAVAAAREAGIGSLSVDLIYGTPGESIDSWRDSITAALATGVDHISAYALIVEDGTALARRVRRGELTAPDDDEAADKYLVADERFAAAGYDWYEVSNWARPGHECRHNQLYWRSANWWGVGPGAHSHVGGVRWWNVRHPRAYAEALAGPDRSPAQAREVLDTATRRLEHVMLQTRLAEGLAESMLDDAGRSGLVRCRDRGWVEPDRIVLTRPGRLMADAVVRELTS